MPETNEQISTLRKIWNAWKHIGQMIGDFLARIVLSIFYFTIFLPFGLGVRLFGDPLAIKNLQPTWIERNTHDRTLEDARRLS